MHSTCRKLPFDYKSTREFKLESLWLKSRNSCKHDLNHVNPYHEYFIFLKICFGKHESNRKKLWLESWSSFRNWNLALNTLLESHLLTQIMRCSDVGEISSTYNEWSNQVTCSNKVANQRRKITNIWIWRRRW